MSPLVAQPRHLNDWFSSDIQFHLLYPESIQKLTNKQWTPLTVAKMAAGFLAADDNVRVLDIGSGVGTFCLAAAYFQPHAFFDGIEQRNNLVAHAITARHILGLFNTSFTPGNFTQLNFSMYDHFYFYNSFFENLDNTDKIDDSIAYSPALYDYYSNYLCKELDKMPAGTRIVTYCSWQDEIPSSYAVVRDELDGLLKFYIKK